MSFPCEVIRDLLPLVQDGVASEESCRVVQEHLRQCEHCRQAQPPISEQPEESLDRKILRSVRKTSFGLGFALLLAGTVLGSLLTGTSIGVFYNFLIMVPNSIILNGIMPNGVMLLGITRKEEQT